jgi:hypothetical protein
LEAMPCVDVKHPKEIPTDKNFKNLLVIFYSHSFIEVNDGNPSASEVFEELLLSKGYVIHRFLGTKWKTEK